MKNNLKFRCLIFACSLIIALQNGQVSAQYVTIPDTIFLNALNAMGYSTCISGNQLDTTCALVTNATYLIVSNLNIQDLTGVQYFDSLQSLYCSNNQLTFLPPLPQKLDWLLCDHNNLTTLPALPNILYNLDCSFNQITSIPSLASASNLFYLTLDNNLLTTLPALPGNLGWIQASNNLLTSLPVINGVGLIRVNNNQITSIAGFPTTATLVQFECDNNMLTTIPPIPAVNGTAHYSFKNNLITHLPPFPAYVGRFYIDNNPISCLPQITEMYLLSYNNTQISCLPNAFIIDTASPPVSNLPLCDPLSGCAFYYDVFGKVYFDSNSNCQFNPVDIPLSSFPIILDSSGIFKQQMNAISNGDYSFETGFGNFRTRIADTYFTKYCPSNGINNFVISAFDSVAENKNFALKCPPTFDLTVNSASLNEIFWPGQTVQVNIIAGEQATFYNISCFNTTGTVELIISGPGHYNSPAPGALIPSAISGDTLIWNIADFSLINPREAFNILIDVDSTAMFGSEICMDIQISPVNDLDPLNNVLLNCFEIFNSYDPNIKTVYPSTVFDTLTTPWLNYTIFFQNTGNAPANNIVLIDTLDQNTTAATFKLLSYSHDVICQMLPGNILKFSFPNINLPDSNSNEPLSHGYVSYKIKPGQITEGTVISNTAHIYFDQNPAIVTNTTLNTFLTTAVPEFLEASFEVFPNPFSDDITIKTFDNYTWKNLDIYDMLGNLVYKAQYDGDTFNFSTVHLVSGCYFLKMEINEKMYVRKLIKLN